MSADPANPILKSKHKQPYKADYQGATPEQVAEAILRYRPDKSAKVKPIPKR